MTFHKYQRIEKFGTTEVEGILEGTCHVFPKIDGTNASVWYEDGEIHCASRRRVITPEDDNGGFAAWVYSPEAAGLRDFLTTWLDLRLHGEWLIGTL